MDRGRRYYEEPKLNVKKVIAVVVAILVIIMFVIAVGKLMKSDKKRSESLSIKSYFPVYTNKKWGVIDNNGNIVIEPEYEEYIIIPNNKKDLFICTYDVEYDKKTYKTKVINANNDEIISGYDKIQPVYNYDKGNNIFFDDNVLSVEKDNKYGLVDYTGKVLLNCEYDGIEAVKGIENSLIIKKEDKVGLADDEGKVIVQPEYKEIKSIGDNYQNGYITINSKNKYGVLDFTGNQVLENKYDDISQIYCNNMYIVEKNNKYELIKKSGETVLKDFDSIKSINDENIIVKKDGKYGIKNTSGKELVPAKYQDLEYTFSNYYIAKKDGKYGIIDTANKQMLKFEYENISYRDVATFFEAEKNGDSNTIVIDSDFKEKVKGYISEVNLEKGYFRIRVDGEYKYYNFKFEEKEAKDILTGNNLFLSKKDNKYGYVDKDGNVVVDYIYDDAREQNEYGFIAVKKDSLWGCLDKEGKTIVEPKYTLKDNVYENFIGKWHISEDLNAYYYTDM